MVTGNAPAIERGELEITFDVAPVRGVGEALSLAGTLFLRNLRIIILIEVPLVAVRLFLFDEHLKPFVVSANIGIAFPLFMAYALCFEALSLPTIIYAAVRSLDSGKSTSIAAAVMWGAKKWLPTLLYLGLSTCVVVVGLVLLVVPGIIAAVALCLVGPIVAIEGVRRENPLVRSRDLTEGRLMRIFEALAVCFAVGVAVSFVADLVMRLEIGWLYTGFGFLQAVASHFLTMLSLVFYLDSPKRGRGVVAV